MRSYCLYFRPCYVFGLCNWTSMCALRDCFKLDWIFWTIVCYL